MNKVPYRRDSSHTYRQQIADFITAGKWTLTNYFSFVIVATVNGQPSGHIDGNATGENFGYCMVCGTSIVHHYTVTDSVSKRSVNVGCECITKIFKDRGDIIARSLKSLQEKTKSNYMRPFKHDLLSAWLKKIASTDADEMRGNQILTEVIDYNEETKMGYIAGLVKEIPDAVKNNLPEYQKNVQIFETALDEKLANILDGSGEGPFNYWKYHAYMFPSRNWNPDNMRSQYKTTAEKYDTELPPKWSEIKLTEDQKKEMNQKIVDETNKYINQLNKKMGVN